MTSAHLRPCPACARHARVSEDACPFCGERFAESFRASPRPQAPSVRLSRAALAAFGAGTLALGPACSSSRSGTDGADASDTNFLAPYGLSPPQDFDGGGFGGGGSWDAAQALAKAVLETRQVMLAPAVLKGGPYALRRALELAELVLNETSNGKHEADGRLTAAVR